MQAYFISVVWSCYKFLCQTRLGRYSTSSPTADVEMQFVQFHRGVGVMASSSTPPVNSADLTLSTGLMVTYLNAAVHLVLR